MNIGIAADHRGYNMKEKVTNFLVELGYNVIDYGCYNEERCNYPEYGIKLGTGIKNKECNYGIAICGSAIGISIACNKVKGVLCGKVNTKEEAKHAKENDFVNVIALSGEEEEEIIKDIIITFLNSENNTKDPIYQKRVDMIIEYELNND